MASFRDFMTSNYLKKEDVGEGALVTLRSIERKDVGPKDGPPDIKAVAYFEEFEKPLVLNGTNLQLMSKVAESEDTEDWIGQAFVLYTDENVQYQGKLVGGIRVRKPKAGAKPKGRPAAPPVDDDIPF